MRKSTEDIEKLQNKKTVLEKSFALGLEDQKALEEYGEILTVLEPFDESRLEAKAKEILMGMGL